jgi:hypothetical protein
MKLVLKIAAGILIAWATILISAFVLAALAATAVTQTVVKPKMDQLSQQINNTFVPSTTNDRVVFTNKLPYTNQYECNANNGNWGYNISTTTPFDFICVS